MAVLGGASTVFSIAGNPRTTQPPNAEQKSQSFLPLSDKALAFSVVLKGMPTNHFPFCGYSFQNGLGFQRDGSSFGSGFPIGARAPCWLGNPKGTAFPWQWFPKAAALPWREESNGGQSLPGGKNPKKPGVRGTRSCSQGLVCYTFGDLG